MIKTYREIATPIVTVQAEQFDDSGEMMDKYDIETREIEYLGYTYGGDYIQTSEGSLEVEEGDWIVTDINDHTWVVTNNIFKKAYVEAEK